MGGDTALWQRWKVITAVALALVLLCGTWAFIVFIAPGQSPTSGESGVVLSELDQRKAMVESYLQAQRAQQEQ